MLSVGDIVGTHGSCVRTSKGVKKSDCRLLTVDCRLLTVDTSKASKNSSSFIAHYNIFFH